MKNSQLQNEEPEDSEALEDSELKELESFLIRKAAFWYSDEHPDIAKDFLECCHRMREERAAIEYEEDRYNLINILHVIFLSEICGDSKYAADEFSFDEIPNVENGSNVVDYMLSKATKLCYLIMSKGLYTDEDLVEIMSEFKSEKDYVVECIEGTDLTPDNHFEIEAILSLISSLFALASYFKTEGFGEYQITCKNNITRAVVLCHNLELHNTMMLAEAAIHSRVGKYINERQVKMMSSPVFDIDSRLLN